MKKKKKEEGNILAILCGWREERKIWPLKQKPRRNSRRRRLMLEGRKAMGEEKKKCQCDMKRETRLSQRKSEEKRNVLKPFIDTLSHSKCEEHIQRKYQAVHTILCPMERNLAEGFGCMKWLWKQKLQWLKQPENLEVETHTEKW